MVTQVELMAPRLGFALGEVIAESGYRNGCDEILRASIVEITGSKLMNGEIQEVVDAVLIWWRDGDGDLVDELVDALAYLSKAGQIWLLTPKAGRSGHVEPSDIHDAAPIAGLSQTSTLSIATDWVATRLVARKVRKR